MNSILDIIKKYQPKLKNSDFYGNIYYPDNNGVLQIDRSVLNKMIDKLNSNFEKDVFNINEKILLAFKREIYEEGSLFREDRNYYRIALIDEFGIASLWSEETTGSSKSPDEYRYISWRKIENFTWYYTEDNKNYFRFFIKGSTDQVDLYLTRFGDPKNDETRSNLSALFNEILEFVNNEKQRNIDDYNNLKESIIDCFDEENTNVELAINLLEEFNNNYVDVNNIDEDFDFYYLYKILSVNNDLQRIKLFEEYKLLHDKANLHYSIDVTNLIGMVYLGSNNCLAAVNNFAYSLDNADLENKQEYQEYVIEAYAELQKDFTSIDYNKRKLVFVTDDILHTNMDGLVVLKKGDLPQDIQFPLNHPKTNEVYVCHPINKSSYLPIKEFEKELFTDRLHELMLLLGSLGAKKIDILSNERNINTQNQRNNTQVNASVDVFLTSAKGGGESTNKSDTSLEHELNVKFHQSFNPKKEPFIPNGLVWYHSNLGWQRLANQRLNGNLLKHTEIISTKQVETLSTNELLKLNAEISLLLGRVKIGGNYSTEVDFKSVSEKNYTLEVVVEFEDIDNLQSKQQVLVVNEKATEVDFQVNLNENYKKYAEEVRFMLEDDGVIDDKERRILERLQNNLGLSQDEVAKIEADFLKFNDNEKEYLEEFKAVLADGEVTDKERRLLNRLSSSLGINEERAKQLEATVK